MVTHAAIDGYSRLITFLHCSDNNRASTVYDKFLQAIEMYGLPSRVRCDQGRENVLVVRHMLRYCGIDRRSALVGSSVHNQRIERLWKDLHRCVTLLFYRLFYHLEYHDLLDPINDVHIYSLHYVFLPRINKAMTDFQNAWNHHGVRTERRMTPHQLFTSGMLRLCHSGLTAMDLFENVESQYGNEEEGLIPEADEGQVDVPQNRIELTSTQFQQLQDSIDPMDECSNYGISIYLDVIRFLTRLGHI